MTAKLSKELADALDSSGREELKVVHPTTNRLLAGLTGSNVTIANTDAADIQILGLKVTSPGGGLQVENAFPLSNILYDSPKEAIVANDGGGKGPCLDLH